MTVQLRPMTPRVSVAPADDGYKKYWIFVLGGFVLTGAWLCLPVMETQVGSGHYDAPKPADSGVEQSLDSADNPNGAQGSAIDLDMGLGRHKSRSDEPIESMLYQAPPEVGAAAAGAPLGSATAGSAASASLASQLKNVADKKDGGWHEKARRGFDAPHLNGSGLSGAGSASGGSGASASVNVSAFGARTAGVSFGATHGLKDDGQGDKGPGSARNALNNASAMSKQAAAQRSGDAARNGLSAVFDGAKAQAAAAPDVGGGGSYAALDQAPVNLKVNDPKLDQKQLKDPPATDVPTAQNNDQMMKQMGMMIASAVIGGMIGGTAGQMVMMAGMMAMQQQQATAASQKSSKCQSQVQQTGSSAGCS